MGCSCSNSIATSKRQDLGLGTIFRSANPDETKRHAMKKNIFLLTRTFKLFTQSIAQNTEIKIAGFI